MLTSSSTDFAVRIRNVGKVYRIYDKPQDRLKQMLFARFGKNYGRNFCALQEVSFEITPGETLGIIGRNGSGKSTLLQILAGTLAPSWGEVEIRGRVAALLELGSGFNPEFTGRENVNLTAAIAGLSRKQTLERFDAIAAFADIGEFIDQPVKTYSSGMMMRLAFAVQTAIDPNVLIIDEALSVGDFFFQQKCFRRIRQMRDQGVTILFVSHDMSVVRDLCQRAIYLRHGEMAFSGACYEAISHYFREDSSTAQEFPTPGATTPSLGHPQDWLGSVALWQRCSTEETSQLLAVALLDRQRKPTTEVRMGGDLLFWILIRQDPVNPRHVSVALKNRHDQTVAVFGSYTLGLALPEARLQSYALLELRMTASIEAGPYMFSVTLGKLDQQPNRGLALDQTPWLGPFTVVWDYENWRAPFLGMFGVPVQGQFLDLSEEPLAEKREQAVL
jgi:lipopolysaccharide transport system ATP-binding protein